MVLILVLVEVGFCEEIQGIIDNLPVVLILVLVEVGFCDNDTGFIFVIDTSLNPCFSGSWVLWIIERRLS